MPPHQNPLAPLNPALGTPKKVSIGSVSHPTGNGPKPSGLSPKLASPKVQRAPTNRPLNY